MPATQQKTILLIAEAVTLAHFARIASLAKALADSPYRIVVAADPRYAFLDEGLALTPLRSIPSAQFAHALARGKPLYSAATLARYVEEDLELIDRVRPDLVIGDFRLSLAVSAPLRRVPYAAVVNAYWSPYAETPYPVPDLPMTRLLGVTIAQRLFDLARPLAFALHAAPLNRVRRRYGLPALGHDLRRCYTWGDYTLYADIPELVPTRDLPAHHRYLGPILWSTPIALPQWWHDLPQDRPVVCLTLGSSGDTALLPAALQALARLPVTLIAATLGTTAPPSLPANVHLADYLPLEAALERAQLLVCNGGSLSTYQALACGVPAVGVCSNMDQLLNMGALQRLGCGIPLRAGRLRPDALAAAAQAVLADASCADRVVRMRATLARYDAAQRLRDTVAEILA